MNSEPSDAENYSHSPQSVLMRKGLKAKGTKTN